jgi:uncharacterized protein
MNKDIIKKIILENQQRIPGLEIIKRDYSPEPEANYIFTGQRRVGKTYFMFSLVQDLLKKGNTIEKVLYINFEDERLIGLDVTGLDAILESYHEMFSHTPVLFFDELQNITGWQKFARRMADSGFRIYLTGSNSEMLSAEMASTLGGRFMVMEIESLSFGEFLLFHGVIPGENIALSPARFEVIRLFESYFSEGGFPELIRFIDKKEYLSNLFQKVFLGDIIARNQIRNPFALKMLIKKLAESTMDEVSFNRMQNVISSAGLKVGTSTIIEYVKLLEDAFLLTTASNYLAKISSRESKKKYYFSDNGILSLLLLDPASFQLETLIFNHLRRKYPDKVFYVKDGFEVDFLVQGESLIQVSYSITEPATRKREINSLLKAAEIIPYKNLTVVTFSNEETIITEGLKIEVLPAWKWLLLT